MKTITIDILNLEKNLNEQIYDLDNKSEEIKDVNNELINNVSREIINSRIILDRLNNLTENISNNINQLDLKNLTDQISSVLNNISKFNDFENGMKQISNNIDQLSNNYYSFKNNIFDEIFPIGSYYISFKDTNPSILFGGKWEQIKDRFIIGASNSYKVNSLGGEASHVLTENEMPKHRHSTIDFDYRGMYLFGGTNTDTGPAEGKGYRSHALDTHTSWTGGNSAHNNIPPYIAAFIWRRTN